MRIVGSLPNLADARLSGSARNRGSAKQSLEHVVPDPIRFMVDLLRGTASRRWLSALLVVAALPGCMTVRIESPAAEVRVLRHVGLLRIELPPHDKALVGALSGFGLAGTPLGWSAGYTRQRWAAMGPQCRAVLWVEQGEVDPATRAALSAVAGVCLAEERRAAEPFAETATDRGESSIARKETTP